MDIKEEKRIDNALKKQGEILWYLQCLTRAFYRITEFKKQKFKKMLSRY